jgi:hypothetical protein
MQGGLCRLSGQTTVSPAPWKRLGTPGAISRVISDSICYLASRCRSVSGGKCILSLFTPLFTHCFAAGPSFP